MSSHTHSQQSPLAGSRSPFKAPSDRLSYRSYLTSTESSSQHSCANHALLTDHDREAVLLGEFPYRCVVSRLENMLAASGDESVGRYLRARLEALQSVWDSRLGLEQHGLDQARLYRDREDLLVQELLLPTEAQHSPSLLPPVITSFPSVLTPGSSPPSGTVLDLVSGPLCRTPSPTV